MISSYIILKTNHKPTSKRNSAVNAGVFQVTEYGCKTRLLKYASNHDWTFLNGRTSITAYRPKGQRYEKGRCGIWRPGKCFLEDSIVWQQVWAHCSAPGRLLDKSELSVKLHKRTFEVATTSQISAHLSQINDNVQLKTFSLFFLACSTFSTSNLPKLAEAWAHTVPSYFLTSKWIENISDKRLFFQP